MRWVKLTFPPSRLAARYRFTSRRFSSSGFAGSLDDGLLGLRSGLRRLGAGTIPDSGAEVLEELPPLLVDGTRVLAVLPVHLVDQPHVRPEGRGVEIPVRAHPSSWVAP